MIQEPCRSLYGNQGTIKAKYKNYVPVKYLTSSPSIGFVARRKQYIAAGTESNAAI